MSQLNSEFDEHEVGFEEAYEQPEMDGPALPAGPQYRQRGFSIYTIMLILSFAFLFITSIVMFIEADKY